MLGLNKTENLLKKSLMENFIFVKVMGLKEAANKHDPTHT